MVNDWSIDGIEPQWIEKVDWANYPEKVTLHCAAYPEEYDTARKEIEVFQEIAAHTIEHEELYNGSISLDISADGRIVTITEGDNSWLGAIEYPDFSVEGPPKKAVIRKDGISSVVDDVLEWDLVIHFLVSNDLPSMIFKPDFRVYPNIDYEPYNAGDTGGISVKFPTVVNDEISFNNSILIDDKITISTNGITRTWDGTYFTNNCSGPSIDITSMLVSGNNSITLTLTNGSGPMRCSSLIIQDGTGKFVKVTSGYVKNNAVANETYNLGTFSFNWDGISSVYLTQDIVLVDDRLTISANSHSLSFGGYTNCVSSAFEITSILESGNNSISAQLINVVSAMRCSPLIIFSTTGQSTILHQTGYSKSNATSNETLNLGTVVFDWDGTGKVYVTINTSRPWTNESNIETTDAVMATCYNNTVTPYTTNKLVMEDFGFEIPEDETITRVQVVVKYANNSVIRAPDFATAKNFIELISDNYSLSASQDFVKNTTPATLQTMVFDSANGTLPSFSRDPATYNSDNFKLTFKSSLDRYKTCWIDSIRINIWYQPVYGYYASFSGSNLDDFDQIKGSANETGGKLVVTSVSDAALIVTEESYQPSMVEFKLTPDSSGRVMLILGRTAASSVRYNIGYDSAGSWKIGTENNDDGGWVLKASATGTALQSNVEYNIRVEISSTGYIKVYCNNVLQVAYNKGTAITTGNVGFRHWTSGTFKIDELKISQTKALTNTEVSGTDLGSMNIVLDRDVKKVEISGAACNLPGWIDVNGERQYWKVSYYHDPGEVNGVDGTQTLLFTLDEPTQLIEITTSANYPPTLSGYAAEHHLGSWLQQVEVFF